MSRRSARGALAAGLGVLTAAALPSPAAAPGTAWPAAATPVPSAAAARHQVVLQVTRRPVGRAIPAGFLGLSMEFSSLYAYAGEDARAPNPLLVRLIENLAGARGAVLRFGGDSADRTWWPVPGMARPPWAAYTLSDHWAAVAHGLATSIDGRLILGINLLADSRAIGAEEGAALLRGIGRRRIAAFEIGNEPDLYATQPWYRTSGGQPVTGRSPGYDFRRYLAEVARIRAALPRFALAGPATGTLPWLARLPSLFGGEPGLRMVTFHRYPLNRCVRNPSSPLYPTVAHLLSPAASAGLVRGMAAWVRLAHRHRASFRVDELNAVTCGGEPGVSDTFASALWTLDTQFWMARTGVDSVDVHIHPHAPANQLFTFERRHGRWVASIRPQYYGLLMFNRAAPAGSRLLRVSGGGGALRSWATLARDGRIRVVLINDSLTWPSVVKVRPPAPGRAVPAPGGPGTVERLRAASAHATGGVTLGGQRLGSTNLDSRDALMTG